MSGEIDLYDDHPQAFIDDDQLVNHVKKAQNPYLILPESLITTDPHLYLITSIFGSLGQIRNDARCIN